MNRSKIEWCDHTWNPITGCRHECSYCYARTMTARFAGDVRLNKMAKADYRLQEAADGNGYIYVLDKPMLNETEKPLVYPFGFEPTYHRYRMDTLDKMKMGKNVFVGAMADVFGKWVPVECIKEILDECVKRPQHNYLFLTKNPYRYAELFKKEILMERENMWYGMTVANSAHARVAEEIMQDLPGNAHTFLSIEPILEDVLDSLEVTISNFTDWVIIGAETGRRKGKVSPRKEWIDKIIAFCDEFNVPVFMKDSLIPIMGEDNMRRDYPEGLQRKTISQKMEKKLYGDCAKCKDHIQKSEMITLLARSKRGEQPTQFGFMCRECFKKFCKDLELDVPDLAELAENITIGQEDGKDG